MKMFDYIVQSGLLVALLGLAASAITYGKKWIDARTQEVTSKIQDTTIRHAVDTVGNAATTIVYKLAQTTVDDLKEKAADGKLTAEEIAQLKADSLAEVKQLVGTDVVNTIQSVFGDAEAWITAKIEAAVKSLKLDSPLAIVGDTISYTAPEQIAADTAKQAASGTDAGTAESAQQSATDGAKAAGGNDTVTDKNAMQSGTAGESTATADSGTNQPQTVTK